MGPLPKVLLLLALVVPVTAYVAGSLASPGAPPPADHSPVILRDAPADPPGTATPATPSPPTPEKTPDVDRGGPPDRDDDEQRDRSGDEASNEARVVKPQPTPVGEDDDDEWDDDGPDDDDTDDDTDDGDD
jgi:hypothetical protein